MRIEQKQRVGITARMRWLPDSSNPRHVKMERHVVEKWSTVKPIVVTSTCAVKSSVVKFILCRLWTAAIVAVVVVILIVFAVFFASVAFILLVSPRVTWCIAISAHAIFWFDCFITRSVSAGGHARHARRVWEAVKSWCGRHCVLEHIQRDDACLQ